MSEDKDKNSQEYTSAELRAMIEVVLSEKAQTEEEIAELKKKLEENQNG